jgi:hypothetical protein
MRAGDDRDIDNIAAMHTARAERYGLALDRSAGFARFAISKRRLLAALSPPLTRQVEFFIAEEGANAVAYIVVSRGPDGVYLDEWGDRDPSGARVGAMLQVLAARTPSETIAPVAGWVPSDFHPPQLERLGEHQPREVGMIRGITRPAPRLAPNDVLYFRADVF